MPVGLKFSVFTEMFYLYPKQRIQRDRESPDLTEASCTLLYLTGSESFSSVEKGCPFSPVHGGICGHGEDAGLFDSLFLQLSPIVELMTRNV